MQRERGGTPNSGPIVDLGGLCVRGITCPPGTKSLADTSPVARKIRSGAIIIAAGALIIAGVGEAYVVWGVSSLAWETLVAFGSPYLAMISAFVHMAWTGNWNCNPTDTQIIGGAVNVPRPSRDPRAGPEDDGIP